MNRKQFLLFSGLLASGAAGSWLFRPGAAPMPRALRPRFLARLFDEPKLLRLGELYRRMHPDEDSAAVLLQRLVGARLPVPGGEDPALERRLEQQARDDFARGEVVLLDGWVLSRTEVRQCALLSLLARQNAHAS